MLRKEAIEMLTTHTSLDQVVDTFASESFFYVS